MAGAQWETKSCRFSLTPVGKITCPMRYAIISIKESREALARALHVILLAPLFDQFIKLLRAYRCINYTCTCWFILNAMIHSGYIAFHTVMDTWRKSLKVEFARVTYGNRLNSRRNITVILTEQQGRLRQFSIEVKSMLKNYTLKMATLHLKKLCLKYRSHVVVVPHHTPRTLYLWITLYKNKFF